MYRRYAAHERALVRASGAHAHLRCGGAQAGDFCLEERVTKLKITRSVSEGMPFLDALSYASG